MKKTLLLLCAALLAASSYAQSCMRDSSLLLKPDSVIISPLPYTAKNMVYGIWAACIGQPYTQSVTIKVPAAFTYLGTQIPITSASIATTGAISGLPTGLTYKCDPPNCVFNSGTLGCILIYGTPSNPAQAPDTVELKITASISTPLFPAPISVQFPGPIAPGNYYMPIRPAGQCTSAAYDFNSPISSVKNAPNPFGQQTLIEVESAIEGEFRFEVFNIVGQRVQDQQIRLTTGKNQFTFDAGDLANGSYWFTISSPAGKVSRAIAIQK